MIQSINLFLFIDQHQQVKVVIVNNLNIKKHTIMNHNQSMSFEDKNEFMPAQTQPDPMFDNFMQACFSNPSFFENMKQFYYKQSNTQRSSAPTFPNQNYHSSTITQSQPNLIQQSRSRNADSRSQYNQKSSKLSKGFGDQPSDYTSNPLMKYQPQPQNNDFQQPKQNVTKTASIASKLISNEERLIKTKFPEDKNNYIQNQVIDLNSIKENQSLNIENMDDRPIKGVRPAEQEKIYRQAEERPIKGMRPDQMEEHYKQPEKTMVTKPKIMKKNQPKNNLYAQHAQNLKFVQKDPYNQFQERPIKGITQDFKELVKKQAEINGFKYQDQDQDIRAEPTEARHFLKRGSRQHLSSAMNRSKQPKKQEDDLNKSGLDRSRNITPKNVRNDNRSISQNRVLNKRNNNEKSNINDKSINKGIEKSQQQFYLKEKQRAKPPLGKQKIKQVQNKSTKTNEVKLSPISKKKKKNVFEDNSESSSSSSQEEPYFKPENKNKIQKDEYEDANKVQVIENVYLTTVQLQKILQKYSKNNKANPAQTESEKIKALRTKYTELCNLVQSEKQQFQRQMQKQKEQFEKYKADQMTKIKNERRVMERQVKSGTSNQNLQKEKEEQEIIRQQLEKEKEQLKKREKNNKIMLEKYKKENDELKLKLERLENERNTGTSKKSLNSFTKSEEMAEDKSINTKIQVTKPKKLEQQSLRQEISYKDIKKDKPAKQTKEPKQIKEVNKQKYQYFEQPIIKNKSTSLKNDPKQIKIQNKWPSNHFSNDDSEDSEKEQNELNEQEQTDKQVEWSPTMKLSDLTKINLSIKMVTDQMIDSLFKLEKNLQYRKYQQIKNSPSRTIVNTNRNVKNGCVTNIYSDRSKQLVYDNGTRKESFENGYSVVYFKNGDIKQILTDKTVLYYFQQKQVDQITLSNGVNIYRFENNQVQFHFTNGYIQIRHPDGTIKFLGDHTRR